MVAGRVKYSGPESDRTKRLTPKFQTHRITLPPELSGRRLDQALAELLPQYSRTRIQRWIEEGAVRVNGLAPRARDVVVGGEVAALEARIDAETGVAAEKLPLDIVHQDASIIVLNKPPGLVVHPGAGNREHTLQNALLAHDPKLTRVPRAGLVHRIDKDTSGLLVVARTLEAHACKRMRAVTFLDAIVRHGRTTVAAYRHLDALGAMAADGFVDGAAARHRAGAHRQVFAFDLVRRQCSRKRRMRLERARHN